MPRVNIKPLLHHLKRTFVAGKTIKSTELLKKSPWLKYTIADNARKATNTFERQALRKTLGKNFITATNDKRYRQLLGKQIKGYGKSLTEEVTHPIRSMKKQIGATLYNPKPTSLLEPGGIRYKPRSHISKAIQGGLLFGLPISFGVSSLRDKDPDKPRSEKIIKSIPEFLSMLTLKGIPSIAAYQTPSLIYAKKNKQRKEKAIADRINAYRLSNYPMINQSRLNPIISAAERRF